MSKVLVFAHLASVSAQGTGRKYLLNFDMFPQHKDAEILLTQKLGLFHYHIGIISLSSHNYVPFSLSVFFMETSLKLS